MSPDNMNFSKMPSAKLAVYIMDIQHPYLLKALCTFKLCAGKITEATEKEPGNRILADTLTRLGTMVEQHLMWEEDLFFPYLRSKIEYLEPDLPLDLPEALQKIKSEHAAISRLIKKARLISNGYRPSSSASPALRLCYAQLFDFEQDMLKHFFLEDNILFLKLFNK